MKVASPCRPAVILLGEDEPLVRMLGVDVLEDAGFAVVEATNAAEALKTLETTPEVRVLFTDVNMPGQMDGLQLARLVHEQRPVCLRIEAICVRNGCSEKSKRGEERRALA